MRSEELVAPNSFGATPKPNKRKSVKIQKISVFAKRISVELKAYSPAARRPEIIHGAGNGSTIFLLLTRDTAT